MEIYIDHPNNSIDCVNYNSARLKWQLDDDGIFF